MSNAIQYPKGLKTILHATNNEGLNLELSFGFAFFSAKRMANELQNQGFTTWLIRTGA